MARTYITDFQLAILANNSTGRTNLGDAVAMAQAVAQADPNVPKFVYAVFPVRQITYTPPNPVPGSFTVVDIPDDMTPFHGGEPPFEDK